MFVATGWQYLLDPFSHLDCLALSCAEPFLIWIVWLLAAQNLFKGGLKGGFSDPS